MDKRTPSSQLNVTEVEEFEGQSSQNATTEKHTASIVFNDNECDSLLNDDIIERLWNQGDDSDHDEGLFAYQFVNT